jgi:hypothetical protein
LKRRGHRLDDIFLFSTKWPRKLAIFFQVWFFTDDGFKQFFVFPFAEPNFPDLSCGPTAYIYRMKPLSVAGIPISYVWMCLTMGVPKIEIPMGKIMINQDKPLFFLGISHSQTQKRSFLWGWNRGNHLLYHPR